MEDTLARFGGFPAMFDRINLGWILGNQARWWFDNFSFHPVIRHDDRHDNPQ